MKKSIVLYLLAVVAFMFVLTSCQKEDSTPSPVLFSEEEIAEINENTCLAVIPDDFAAALDETPPLTGIEERASGMKSKYWTSGATIRVKFLNGSTYLQNKVMQYAEQWEQNANFNLVKVTSGNSEIRVYFSSEGNYSAIGNDAQTVSQSQKTMNLALTDNSSESLIRRKSLHEFGHAIGLGHEHQSPLANIPWNVPAVYAFYAQPPNNWSQSKVDQQILNKNTWAQSQHTDYDQQSIMQYSVASQLTTNGFSISESTQLSATDKDFIGRIYSNQKIKVRHAANASYAITFWLNGIYHTIQPGESMWVPAKTSGNQLSIWECVGSNCAWDGYAPPYGYNYKIVSTGSTGNLTLAYD